MSVHSASPHAAQLSGVDQKLIEKYLREHDVDDSIIEQRIERRPANEPIPLSFSQQQVWVHSQMAGNIPVYNEAITIYRRGPLDVAVLERCLAEIVRRHEIWRTTFDAKNGQPFQIIRAPSDQFPLRATDLRGLPASALFFAEEDAWKPFDLKQGPLLRAMLVRTGEEEYRLLVTFHQIVFDAVSAYRVLLPELAALYEAFSTGKPSPLPEPTLQYADFAYWQQKTVKPEAWSKGLSFWRGQLSNVPVLQWPNDRSRPAYQTHRGALQRYSFDTDLIPPLRAFCKRENVSSYMTCLAAFAALLSRYAEQQEMMIGALSAGRGRPELESMVGYFVNPLALRVNLSGNPTFRELSRRVRDTVLNGLANNDVPFEKVVEELRVRPDASRNPIFQVILSQQPQIAATPPGWDLLSEEVSNGGSKLDMTIVVDERADSISGPITYNPDLFDTSTVSRMVRHWQIILAAALAAPDRRIAELPLLSDSEREEVTVRWNDTKVEYPKYACLHDLIETQISRTPDAVAVKFENQQMTYGELGARSNQLAGYLRSLGVGPDVPVGLYFHRSLDAIVALLGVLKAGGVCLPLDPTYPKERLSFMLAETEAPVLLTMAKLEPSLPAHYAQVVRLDTDQQLRSFPGRSIAPGSTRSDNLAYIIYTSGSTGRPKGVQVTHGGLVNSTLARTTYYRDPVGSFLLLPSFAFDSSLAGLFWTLSTGGALILTPDESRCDLSALLRLVVQHEVSHVLCVPSLYRHLLEEAALERMPSLRVAIVAGEECPKELVESHYRLLPQVALFNEYGPTEATIWCSAHRCEPNRRSARVLIGRPIANVQIYILDSQLQPVPIGIPGELHVAGAGVTRGYLKRPELQAQKFVPNPFSGEPGSYLYKTGDRARYLPDGNIEYLGRVDQQVKIRGFRMEIGEIEAALSDCKGVRASAVAVRDDSRGDKQLVAYIVSHSRNEVTASTVRELLKYKLPEYMVPSSFVFLDVLPFSSNGKIDRQALPAPAANDSPSATFVGPRDDVETRLAKIWGEILGVKNIGVRDNLFDLGAHSLLVARLLARMERELGRKLTFNSIFEAPTIESFAASLRKPTGRPRPTCLFPIQTEGTKPPLFCVCGGLFWRPLSEQLGLDQPVYSIGFDPSLADQPEAPRTVEELAGHLVRGIRDQQSTGPYFLAGFCDGAAIAFETAKQLADQGQRVALLTIVDARNHAYYRRKRKSPAAVWKRLRARLEKLRHLPRAEVLSYGAGLLKRCWQMVSSRASESSAPSSAPETAAPLDLDQLIRTAQEKYQPKPYSGRVALIRTETKSDEALSGWRDVIIGPVEAHEISGTHMSIFFEPQVRQLADRFAVSIEHAMESLAQEKPRIRRNRFCFL